MYDIVALGELLIDFTPISVEKGKAYFPNPGGAPCNVLAIAKKLGLECAFLGKVGDDQFGHLLSNKLQSLEIDTQGLIFDKEIPTTLAFVHLDNSGNRSFSFYRKPGADLMLKPDEVAEKAILNSKLFHCGSLSLTSSPAREATIKALSIAKNNGIVISVDPNLRENLWENLDDAKTMIRKLLSYADIIKISDYELDFLYGDNGILMNSQLLSNEFYAKIFLITCGANGAYIKTDGELIHHPSYNVKTIDTTGAGDAFCGAALFKILRGRKPIDQFDREELLEIISFANAAASLSTTGFGAIDSMPGMDEIVKLMEGKDYLVATK